MRARRIIPAVGLVLATTGVAVATLAVPSATAQHQSRAQSELASARQFTAGLRTPARAEAAGWFDSGLPCFDNPGAGSNNGGMGLHWLRKAPDGAVPDPGKPEALVFDPASRTLVAVEYVVLKDAWVGAQPPSLFGHTFTPATLPNGAVVYKLHAWLWRPNSNGMFADFSPSVPLCP